MVSFKSQIQRKLTLDVGTRIWEGRQRSPGVFGGEVVVCGHFSPTHPFTSGVL